MLKVLLPVDGSKSATRAAKKLVETLAWYKSRPQIDLLAVHLPVPRFANMGAVVSNAMIERYYAEECNAMLKPSRKILDAAHVRYAMHTAVGALKLLVCCGDVPVKSMVALRAAASTRMATQIRAPLSRRSVN